MDYTHLLYVRKYSMLHGDMKLYVYGVCTEDILHTIGEMYFRSEVRIDRIDVKRLTSENRDAVLSFWRSESFEIIPWVDKYMVGEL